MLRTVGSRIALALNPLLVALSLVQCGGSGSARSSFSGQQNALGAAVDAVAHAGMQQQGVPGMTVALAKNGSMLYVHAYGISDLTTNRATQNKDVFEIGSITKQFTAVLVMQLQEQGKLHVDDSISQYLPEYGFPAAITLRMMLNNTSGLQDFTNFAQLGDWVKHGVSESTVLTAVSAAPIEFAPGTQYSYSSSNFFALGTIIEKVTGQTYAANLEQNIFQPLAMANTYYALPPASVSAVGYTNNGAGLVPAILWDRSAAFAAGALSSNVYDLAAWDNALIHGKVVSAAAFAAMTAPNGFQIPGGGSYGFGLALDTFNGKPIIWHNGQIGGFTAETAVFLNSGFSVVVMTNDQLGDPDAVVLAIMNAVCNASQFSGTC